MVDRTPATYHSLTRVALLLFAVALWAGGCDCSDQAGENLDDQCSSSAECPEEEECINGVCTDASLDAGFLDDAGIEEDAGVTEDADCSPITCHAEGVQCGTIIDGCGGTQFCGRCPMGQLCADGEQANECVPIDCNSQVTCEDQDVECGVAPDGCGGTLNCGACASGEMCVTENDTRICVPIECELLTCDDYDPGECGKLLDGCGGLIDCGSCGNNETCNTNTEYGKCEAVACTPLECSDYSPGECGPHPDGCGGSIDCGSCNDGEMCGTGDNLGTCVESACEPLTCDDYNVDCGVMSDGCGGLTESCGECTNPEICGGGGVSNVCSSGGFSDQCVNLCQEQVNCSNQDQPTTITGTVFAPNGTLPVPNATVYVPNDELDTLPDVEQATTCTQCQDVDLGSPLVGTISEWDGSFTLENVPAGTEFPLVIRHGQWRRVVMVGPVNACESLDLSAQDTSLPAVHRGDVNGLDEIPRIAVSTGAVDAMECVLRNLGIDESEFSRHYQDGRVHLWRANGALADQELADACDDVGCGYYGNPAGMITDQVCMDRYPDSCGDNNQGLMLQNNLSHNLYQDADTLDGYDMVVMGCEAMEHTNYRTEADKNRIRDYVNSGGRLFASHYAYDWLHETDELEDTAVWGGAEALLENSLAFVDDTFPQGMGFWNWLTLVGADYPTAGPNGEPQIEIEEPRTYVRDINDNFSTRWIYTDRDAPGHPAYDSVQQYTFQTPVQEDEDQQCGQVAYSAFHVAGSEASRGPAFPNHCDTDFLTDQQKVLAFMLFSIAGCVTDGTMPLEPECSPAQDCGAAECGMISDGCGGSLNCGSCPDGTSCGAGGEPNVCGGACEPLSCESHNAECGSVDDGCGGTLECGPCPDGYTCGGDGEPYQCGCQALSCEDHGAQCGAVDDGCGGTLECGDCPDEFESCGGGGQANICGGACDPLVCEDHNAECGTVDDGCGGTLECGSCPKAMPSCGGDDAQPNQCVCEPLTCEDHNAECGLVDNGCEELIDCGECADGTCSGNMCI